MQIATGRVHGVASLGMALACIAMCKILKTTSDNINILNNINTCIGVSNLIDISNQKTHCFISASSKQCSAGISSLNLIQ